ncbi:glutamate 5-kinase [Treponema endosymbiont of Eucomonympha sp.]|uniref:glutamate 5-kinase n=1 Tax=Treponema endosymbiont of Eucomonympha sp. TaxID=1580831 RepID=UPI000750B014|nr:glutamate 5-kinase [Treponema endosymbiont of Eucomonympha sp.]
MNSSAIQDAVAAARKIVIKIGSNTLAREDGTIDIDFMNGFACQCGALMGAGKQLALVSSGAQVAGISTLDRWSRKTDIHYRQALCAIGQVELMDKWRSAFSRCGIHIGQLLFTKEDFQDDHRTLNMRNTLFTLLDEGVVPVINENDSVTFDEIRIGDNDNLSALTAILWNADLLILFSDIDGIFTDNPKTHPGAALVETVRDTAELLSRITMGAANDFGTGGVRTKIEAAEKAAAYGIPVVLANGKSEQALERLAAGGMGGTLFLAQDE